MKEEIAAEQKKAEEKLRRNGHTCTYEAEKQKNRLEALAVVRGKGNVRETESRDLLLQAQLREYVRTRERKQKRYATSRRRGVELYGKMLLLRRGQLKRWRRRQNVKYGN